jgi:hypothetical protein
MKYSVPIFIENQNKVTTTLNIEASDFVNAKSLKVTLSNVNRDLEKCSSN